MKKLLIVLLLVLCISTAYAKRYKRPLVQIDPKATLYIGSVRFGFGAEVVFNPLKNLGFRMDLTEISFGDGGTLFTLNRGTGFDVLIYIPMKGLQPYAFAGFGLSANGGTNFTIDGGMGFDFVMNKKMNFFVEPGIIISSISVGGVSNTDFMFKVSGGAKFGIF
jgi:hypothetical protein